MAKGLGDSVLFLGVGVYRVHEKPLGQVMHYWILVSLLVKTKKCTFLSTVKGQLIVASCHYRLCWFVSRKRWLVLQVLRENFGETVS